MADYDVGALSLSVPPASAVLQSYRPAVLVRNNGVHDALASGTLRIYSPAGLLIFTTEIYSGTIAPGNTEPAQATDYWTPPAIGRYQVIAYVSCPLDQYEPNNSLAPRFVDVTGAPPPPEPTVPLHAAQHEEGGGDELNIDGLHGRATDAQTALAHKTSHQVAGADELDLTGMGGILRDGQPIADHHETHEDGGGDELYVAGLHGELADNQPAKVHDNAKHDPNYATVTEFNNHLADTTAVHAVAENLEQLAHKGEPDGYPELDEYGHVPPQQLAVWTTPPPANDKALLPNQTFGYPFPAAHTADEHDDTVEATANKGQASGYPELDEFGHVPPERLGTWTTPPPANDKALTPAGVWDYPKPAAHAPTHKTAESDPLDLSGFYLIDRQAGLSTNGTGPPAEFSLINVTTPFLHNRQCVRFSLHCILTTALGEVGAAGFWFNIAGALKGQISFLMVSNHTYRLEVEGIIHACSATQFAGSLNLLSFREDAAIAFLPGASITPFAIPNTDTWMKVVGDINGLVTSHLDLVSSFARTELPPTV